MTRQRHYHPLAALRFLRKAVVVCLLPLANALLEFSLNALLTALRQDAALLLFLCGASWKPAAGRWMRPVCSGCGGRSSPSGSASSGPKLWPH